MIPWPPSEHDTDYATCDTTSSTVDVVYDNVASTVTDKDWQLAEEERAALLAEQERERKRKARERRRRKRSFKPQGRGHDPRRQVICRSRVQGRGKGRR